MASNWGEDLLVSTACMSQTDHMLVGKRGGCVPLPPVSTGLATFLMVGESCESNASGGYVTVWEQTYMYFELRW